MWKTFREFSCQQIHRSKDWKINKRSRRNNHRSGLDQGAHEWNWLRLCNGGIDAAWVGLLALGGEII